MSDVTKKQKHKPVNTPGTLPAGLNAAGQQRCVRQILRGGPVQAKLKVSQPEDVAEIEADRVADQVMRMPDVGAIEQREPPAIQRAGVDDDEKLHRQVEEEEEEEELLQAKRKSDSESPVGSEEVNNINALAGQGRPIAENHRVFFETHLGVDLTPVRIHADARAEQLNASLNARAFTRGNDIFFGAQQYQPQSPAGRHLLAHELTHVLQQRAGGQPIVQRRCALRRPPAGFDLATTGIWRQIRSGLNAITRPNPQPRQPRLPLYNPASVLEILNSSNCFLHDAQTVEQNFPDRAGGLPSLIIRLHEREETGSHFIRRQAPRASLIESQVTDQLDRTVRNIVHEIVHASHQAPQRATSGRRRVTRTEAAVIQEEAATRTRENDIMDELYRAGRMTRVAGSATELNVIRADFVSGRPRLTYQENAIVGEMKTRYLSNDLSEARATGIARAFVAQGQMPQVSRANLSRFTLNESFVQPHELAVGSAPIAPPGFREALICVNQYYHLSGSRLTRWRASASPACRELSRVINTRSLQRDPQTQRLTLEGRGRLQEILRDRGLLYTRRLALHNARQGVVQLYRSLLENNDQARFFFEWVLIGESMSAEWLALGDGASARQRSRLRGRHRQLLRGRIGGGLAQLPSP